ncbi:MAG: tetratricopeptide repeat protein [Myxococcales bacterium]|nr:tetratricopeptide repeat protein [Myxococcales bacterium]
MWLQEQERVAESEEPFRACCAEGDGYCCYNLGVALQDLDRFAEAEEPFRQGCAILAESWAAGCSRNQPTQCDEWAWCLLLEGRTAEAERAERRAVAEKTSNAAYREVLGHILMAQGRAGDALAQFRRAVRLDASCARTIRGYLGLMERLYPEAVEAIDRVREELVP